VLALHDKPNTAFPNHASRRQGVFLDVKKMFLDGAIGRRGMTIQLPLSILAKNIILTSLTTRKI
jgi:hypothetical protein